MAPSRSFVITTLSIITTVCGANLFCKINIPSIHLSLPDINEIKGAITTLFSGRKLLGDIPKAEVGIFKDAFNGAKANEDVKLNVTQLITKYGFEVETHEVTTEDGYILTMFRIPSDGEPVFVMHGLLSSADDFVVAGPESALAYHLAREGYDVWLGNARGNKHSRRHTDKSPDCADFWEFSWEDIGVYDLPAMIDYVLQKTDRTSLSFIGYSQGTTTFFVMASERPEYNEKVNFMTAMAPIAYMSKTFSPLIRLLSLNTEMVYLILKAIGVNEFSPNTALSKILSSLICANNAAANIVCSNLIASQFGFGDGELNVTNLPVVFNHFPAGGSSKQLAHYGQLIGSKSFCKFDYGSKENKKTYGSNNPPSFNLENINVPIALVYSDKDWLANVTDVERLKNELPNVVEFHLVVDYSHLDFTFSRTIKEKVYEPIVSYLRKYYN